MARFGNVTDVVSLYRGVAFIYSHGRQKLKQKLRELRKLLDNAEKQLLLTMPWARLVYSKSSVVRDERTLSVSEFTIARLIVILIARIAT